MHDTRLSSFRLVDFSLFCLPPCVSASVNASFYTLFASVPRFQIVERENLNNKNNVIYDIVMWWSVPIHIYFSSFFVYERAYFTRSVCSVCVSISVSICSVIISLSLLYLVHYEFRIWLLKKLIWISFGSQIYFFFNYSCRSQYSVVFAIYTYSNNTHTRSHNFWCCVSITMAIHSFATATPNTI